LPHVALERRLIAAAALRREVSVPELDWQKAAAELEAQFPSRWALPEAPDDPLDAA
jgi:hypothetical protein